MNQRATVPKPQMFDAAICGEAAPHFRPIHYLGSKLRMLPAIVKALDGLDPDRGPVCDLFSGSGTVSFALSAHRQVFSVDIQEYARVLCSAITERGPRPDPSQLSDRIRDSDRLAQLVEAAQPLIRMEEIATRNAVAGDLVAYSEIVEQGTIISLQTGEATRSAQLRAAKNKVLRSLSSANLAGQGSVCLRHYGGTFFSYRQAIVLDAAARVCRQEFPGSDLAVAALLGAASSAVNTVGKQFAQPLRLRGKDGILKAHLRTKILSDRAVDVLAEVAKASTGLARLPACLNSSTAIRSDYAHALTSLKGRISVVYADPPYTRDHYSRYYHVLETIALGDDPELSMSNLGGGVNVSRGSYRADRHQSDFCIKSKAPDAFSRLFAGVRELGIPLLLSYSSFENGTDARPRVLAIDTVLKLASKYFANVKVADVDELLYSRLNHTRLNKTALGTKEVLISCC